MNYEEAMSFLEDTKQYGSRLGLDTIRALMHELGDVQDKVPAIHISGTNGKGSVGAMLSSILTESGYKVGWFNSPEVFSYEEEFRICGEPISRERLAQIFTGVKAACEKVDAKIGRSSQEYYEVDDITRYNHLNSLGVEDTARYNHLKSFEMEDETRYSHLKSSEVEDETLYHHPTSFEVETAAAFLWFYEEQCDILIIEVGMGGADDATNVIESPLVSVLTSISKDHIHTLGYTLPEIAGVKAGIIKPGCPVVTVEQEPDVMDVILKRCSEAGAPLYRADAGMTEDFSYADGVSSFDWGGRRITLGLHAPLQTENASCALKVVDVLRECYPERYGDISDENVVRALAKTRWPGRYERLELGDEGVMSVPEPELGDAGEMSVPKLELNDEGVMPVSEPELGDEGVMSVPKSGFGDEGGMPVPDGPGRLFDADDKSRGHAPTIILDGAHNEAAALRLREALDADFPGRRIVYIMGVLADKDFGAMARIMFNPGDRVYTVTTSSPRALPAKELAEQLSRQDIDAVPCGTARDAVAGAMAEAGAGDVILAFGSLYCLGEIREAFHGSI